MKRHRLRSAALILFALLFVPAYWVSAQAAAPITREFHWAVTGEKFELALERRRPESRLRYPLPLILAHGLFAGSALFNFDENHSLAGFLAAQGFDVWNLSQRGSGRSLNPLKGGPKSWTLDDVMAKDIPMVIRYVQKETRSRKVLWLGYDVGGLLAYGYLEREREPALAGVVTIGAPVTFSHAEQQPMKGLLKLQASPTLKKIFLYLNFPMIARPLIRFAPEVADIFFNPDNIDEEIKEKVLDEGLLEINSGVLDHFLTMIQRGEFVSAKGDFSYRKNLAKVNVPALLLAGEADKLAPPQAVRTVYENIGSADRTLRVFGPQSKDSAAYGHIDLILGKKAKAEVYPVIAKWLKRVEIEGH